ncbi:hypothetical protein F5J12DRAFT_779659 [Pisolithus orientalis]|uniref:uncharacterized protein n=1 Tax=Pisolithus orientalis TaxID=936130 RepID=UPI002223FF45|nr:uncharacterized protein F5J12DRAFT_779659 [Pisolithus orientalis]KAI6030520.1 hypothetical protein F5J12DRAFT_779659 [Pisolithus orientalis]
MEFMTNILTTWTKPEVQVIPKVEMMARLMSLTEFGDFLESFPLSHDIPVIHGGLHLGSRAGGRAVKDPKGQAEYHRWYKEHPGVPLAWMTAMPQPFTVVGICSDCHTLNLFAFCRELFMISHLGQLFNALLLMQQPNGECMRVAAENKIVVSGLRTNVTSKNILAAVLESL